MTHKPQTSATHSIRCTDALWSRANARATSEGVSMNKVINEIMEGYADGLLNLPRVVRTFDTTTKTPAVTSKSA